MKEPIDASERRLLRVAISTHSRSGQNIFLYVFSTSSFPFPSSLLFSFTLSPSEKSCVLSWTNSRDKKGLNESRTTASETPYADFFFLFVSHSRVSFRDE